MKFSQDLDYIELVDIPKNRDLVYNDEYSVNKFREILRHNKIGFINRSIYTRTKLLNGVSIKTKDRHELEEYSTLNKTLKSSKFLLIDAYANDTISNFTNIMYKLYKKCSNEKKDTVKLDTTLLIDRVKITRNPITDLTVKCDFTSLQRLHTGLDILKCLGLVEDKLFKSYVNSVEYKLTNLGYAVLDQFIGNKLKLK